MPQDDVTEEFLELERRYWEAIKAGDAARAMSLSDDRTIVVGAQGVGELDKQALGAMMAAGSWELLDYRIEDLHVRPVTDEAVVTAYKVTEHLVVDGAALVLEAYDASLWVRRAGEWVCPLHTESLAGDPFGRYRSKGDTGW